MSLNTNVSAKLPLKGHISNQPDKLVNPLRGECGAADPRQPIRKGNVNTTVLKGAIGITYDIRTGQILSIDAQSDLRHLGIHEGDFILKIEKEAYRPCIMPLVSFYPKGYILGLTIQQPNGIIRSVYTTLLDARKFPDVPQSKP